MLIIAGKFTDVLHGLFRLEADGHVRFGPARSCDPLASLDTLEGWQLFDDYVMEGFVRYKVRALPHPRGLRLDVQLTGTDRDRFVLAFIRDYIRWAGFRPDDPDVSG
jgi:hypothetical protein